MSGCLGVIVPVGPRILFVEGAPAPSKEASQPWPRAGEAHSVPTWASALSHLDHENFEYLLARIDDDNLKSELIARLQAAGILEQIPVAVAMLDGAGKVLWANQNFVTWCSGAP